MAIIMHLFLILFQSMLKLNEGYSSGTLRFFISSDLADKKTKPDKNLSNYKRKVYPGIDLSDVKFELDELSDHFYKICDDFRKDPSEPENIHQMRLCIRKILTLVDFSKDDVSEDSFRHVSKSLRKLNSELSIVRDLDQFIYYAEKTQSKGYFYKMAALQRKEHESDIFYKIDTGTFHDVDNILSSFVWLNKNETLKDVDLYIMNLMRKVEKRRKKLSLDEPEKLHSTRLTGKKIKNIIEIFPDGIKNSTLVLDNDIKKFVKTLGNINDHNNSLKILEILYKLSKNPDMETDNEIVSEYKELKSHFKSLRKDEFRKIKK